MLFESASTTHEVRRVRRTPAQPLLNEWYAQHMVPASSLRRPLVLGAELVPVRQPANMCVDRIPVPPIYYGEGYPVVDTAGQSSIHTDGRYAWYWMLRESYRKGGRKCREHAGTANGKTGLKSILDQILRVGVGGGAGIRTPGRSPFSGFQDQRFHPLSHPSDGTLPREQRLWRGTRPSANASAWTTRTRNRPRRGLRCRCGCAKAATRGWRSAVLSEQHLPSAEAPPSLDGARAGGSD